MSKPQGWALVFYSPQINMHTLLSVFRKRTLSWGLFARKFC